MNYLDIILLIVLVVAFILGFKDGIIRKIIGTAGFFIAIFLGVILAKSAGGVLHSITGIEPYFSEILAGFFVFVIVIVLTSVIKRVVHPFDKINNMVNRILGGITGMIQILFFISAALYLLNVFGIPSQDTRNESFLYSPLASFLPGVIDQIENLNPDTKKSIKEFLIEKDSL
ncbi:MAG: CvpA family protein [Ignavibacteriaceae bacterium]|nr:CvpA family protein [Ignavibacteriaceae bacterium]